MTSWVRAILRPLRSRPALASAFTLSLAIATFAVLLWLRVVPERAFRFERPVLVVLAPISIGAAWSWLTGAGAPKLGRAKRTLVDVLVSLALLALVLASAGVSFGSPKNKLAIIVVVDRSRSIDLVPQAAERIARDLAVAEESMRPEDRIGVVVFGATAAVEQPPRLRTESPTGQRVSVVRDGTDIDRAIRRALAEIPSDAGARIIVLSDGVATRGDALAGASAALAAGVPIDVVPLEQEPLDDIRVVSLRTVSRGDDGESIDLRLVTSAPREADVDVTLSIDGVPRPSTRVRVAAGEDILRIRERLSGAGLHRYDVKVTAVDPSVDFSADDNLGTAYVRVRGRASALVLDSDASKGAFIASALRAAGFDAISHGMGSVPSDLAGFAAYDLVVFGDIPARLLEPSQIAALASYVRDFGGGLLLTGGDGSFGPGGYGKTPLEDVSPCSFDIKQDDRRQRLSEVIAIDISGSMAAPVGSVTKLDLANEAAARSASLLDAEDRLGVDHVDTMSHWSVKLAPLGDAANVEQAIRSMHAGGGGIIVPVALQDGYDALSREDTALKHMLLFADGADAEHALDALALTEDASKKGITTSVVALGNGSDVKALEEMARIGGGRFYLVEDALRLPAVFAEETVLAARSAIHEDPFQVALRTPSAITHGIEFAAAPALLGYVVTIPKSRATVSLVGPDDDPILATWSVGIGRSALFASDLKDRWGPAWTTWSGAARLLGQLAHDLERKGDDERVTLDTDTSGGELHIRANVTDESGRRDSFRRLSVHVGGPGGFSDDVELEPIAPGEYAGNLPLTRPGNYAIVASDAVTQVPMATTGASLSFGEELRPTGTDRATLERIASVSRGKVRRTLEGAFLDRERMRLSYTDLSPWITLAAAVMFLSAVAARRLSLPTPRWSRLLAWLPDFGARGRRETDVGATLPALLRVKDRGGVAAKPTEREPERKSAPGDGEAMAIASLPHRVRAAPRPRVRVDAASETAPPVRPPTGSPPAPAPARSSPPAVATASRPPAKGASAVPPAPTEPAATKPLSTMEMLAAKKRKR